VTFALHARDNAPAPRPLASVDLRVCQFIVRPQVRMRRARGSMTAAERAELKPLRPCDTASGEPDAWSRGPLNQAALARVSTGGSTDTRREIAFGRVKRSAVISGRSR
jgi:hypothetical protein